MRPIWENVCKNIHNILLVFICLKHVKHDVLSRCNTFSLEVIHGVLMENNMLRMMSWHFMRHSVSSCLQFAHKFNVVYLAHLRFVSIFIQSNFCFESAYSVGKIYSESVLKWLKFLFLPISDLIKMYFNKNSQSILWRLIFCVLFGFHYLSC